MEPITVRTQTDTAHPQASIPIYAVHTMQKPLCDRPSCWCQTNKASIAQLLEALENGTMILGAADTFAEHNQA